MKSSKFIFISLIFFFLNSSVFATALYGDDSASLLQKASNQVKTKYNFNNMSLDEKIRMGESAAKNPASITPAQLFMLADSMSKKDVELAFTFVKFAELRLATDIFMCNDKPAFRMIRCSSYFAPVTYSKMINNPNLIKSAKNRALEWDKNFPPTYDIYWACDKNTNLYYEGGDTPYSKELYSRIKNRLIEAAFNE